MRLSEWRGRAPHKDALTPKVVAVIEPALVAMGAGPDPDCWVAWGDDPAVRYVVLVPTDAGLVQVHVRVNVPQEGPRSAAKLIRWNRVQSGEFSVEVTGGHRLVSFQVEGHVMRGSDVEADAIALFARQVFDAIDGRSPTIPAPAATATGAGSRTPAAAARRTPRSGG